MTEHLRNIALFVDEPDTACFYWVLVESTEDASVYGAHSAAEEPEHSYLAALTKGVEALKALSLDLTVVPRALGEDENRSPAGGVTVSAHTLRAVFPFSEAIPDGGGRSLGAKD